MAEIVKIKKDGVIQYPITKPECVIDENGKNVLQLIKENGGGEGCECATPDWSALEGEQGHILNRPCYYELSEMNIFETEVMAGLPYRTTMYGGDLFRFKVLGETFDIDLSGKEIPTYDYDHDIQYKLSYSLHLDTIRVSIDFYDGGDGALTMEFRYEALEGKDAPDELTLYVGEYVVSERQRLSEGLIPQTIARTSELTELSAEVSGLSERIDNLPTAESSVFEAVFGVTTYDEIVEAVKAKKHIICFHKNRVYNLCNFQQGMDLLFTCAAAAIYTITLKITDGKWIESQYDYEIAINKVTTINESSTNTKYPSAKAVYDFVSNTLGTIINGDY